jgi:cobalt-precorrin-5B (C1)-methyltransferase
LGQRFARSSLNLPLKSVVQMSNFVGFALECVNRTLEEENHKLSKLWIVGHPGKLAKILEDCWDTHSQTSKSPVKAICAIAERVEINSNILKKAVGANSIEAAIEIFGPDKNSAKLWNAVQEEIGNKISEKIKRVDSISVRLFQMNGEPLGE